MGYGRTITMAASVGEVLPQVVEAFKAQGFGMLTEIDVQATLKEKLGEDIDPYMILGACNPRLAHRALQLEPEVGLLLPCNVVVRRHGEETMVSAVDPEIIAEFADHPRLADIAEEAAELIGRALDSLVAS